MAETVVGITGHQERDGIDWTWVRGQIDEQLAALPATTGAMSSLAAGSDQVFTEACLAAGIPVTAVIPKADYEACFKPEYRARYRALLAQCDVVELDSKARNEQAFYEAGQYIVDHCESLFAVWDGKPAAGFGGTADVVEYACKSGRTIILIDPIAETTLSSGETKRG